MFRSITRWVVFSTCLGPLITVLLGFLFLPISGLRAPTLAFISAYVVYWGAWAILVSMTFLPAVTLLYTAWALLSSRAHGLDRHVVPWSLLLAVPVGIALGISVERADANDVGRAFSEESAVLISTWLSLSLWVAIAAPRIFHPSLYPGTFNVAAAQQADGVSSLRIR